MCENLCSCIQFKISILLRECAAGVVAALHPPGEITSKAAVSVSLVGAAGIYKFYVYVWLSGHVLQVESVRLRRGGGFRWAKKGGPIEMARRSHSTFNSAHPLTLQ